MTGLVKGTSHLLAPSMISSNFRRIPYLYGNEVKMNNNILVRTMTVKLWINSKRARFSLLVVAGVLVRSSEKPVSGKFGANAWDLRMTMDATRTQITNF